MVLHFEKVVRHFPGRAEPALDGLELALEAEETVCLIGPSGCGKTTLLRLANRMEAPDSGRVLFQGQNVAGQDPVRLRRSMGYVIQEGGLLPHRTVRENTGLLGKVEGWSKEEIEKRSNEVLERVRLDPGEYGDALPAALSGGQRQRVGVARALLLDPPLLLLDEPFGALDPITRAELQDDFLAFEGLANKTVLFVTHDLDEAFRMGDRTALLGGGNIVQIGSESDFESNPANAEVERFVARHLRSGAEA